MAHTLLFVAIILIGIRLPSVMRRLEMKNGEKIAFVLILFGLLGLVWLAVYGR